MNPRTVIYLRVKDEYCLQTIVDCFDDDTMIYITHGAQGVVGVFTHVSELLVKEYSHITSQGSGVLIVPKVIALKFNLVPHPRRDELLIHIGEEGGRCTFEHPQVFPCRLQVMLYHPDHMMF